MTEWVSRCPTNHFASCQFQRLGSGSRTSRNSRSSSDSRRYRTLAPNSQVDETLFGNPKPLDRRGNSAPKAKNQSQNREEGTTIQLISKDLIRNLRVPFRDPSGESVILPSDKFEQITARSRVLTKEEKEAQKEAHQRKRQEEIAAAEERNLQILQADQSGMGNKVLTELEQEAQHHAQCLVERARAVRAEQEEEIKKLNKLILSAQCQATRDAQILEKKEIQKELSEEEKRLDAMMELERRKALETEEQIHELRKQQRISGMQQIYEQIQKRLEDKNMEEEMKEHEKQRIRDTLEKMNLEDLQALEKKRKEQQLLQVEIMRINAETMQTKEQMREEEKLADLREMEYIRKKMEREAEHEAEQRRIKKEKELEITRMRARQERAKDYKAEQDALRARRHQESADREWRRKEKELAAKKAQDDAMLRAARVEQVHCKEHLLSMEAGREKAEFERVLKVQQEAIMKEKEEEGKQRQKAQRHAEAIRNQVRECELSAIAQRRQTFKEADRLMEEARQRQARLNEIKQKKLRELKATGLSEKYCREVERKTRAVEP
ncbi:cilia- and flagella-associated protein 45 isoform X2 [Antennarius striatus]|uniref:cilia- and flagella-associated protein 45 isoform X2 n=1 Tax=Antennarius striatus TaxID=241820 RepID=UPI0035B4DBB6